MQVTGNSTFVVNSFKRMVVKGWQKIRTIMLYIPAKKKNCNEKATKAYSEVIPRIFKRRVRQTNCIFFVWGIIKNVNDRYQGTVEMQLKLERVTVYGLCPSI